MPSTSCKHYFCGCVDEYDQNILTPPDLPVLWKAILKYVFIQEAFWNDLGTD